MDIRERFNSQTLLFQSLLRQERADMWTALPAVVVSFDAAACTVEAQATIQARILTPSANGYSITWQTLPNCLDCPVMFPGGGGFLASFPLAQNDEGLLIFSSRCIDSWWQSGGSVGGAQNQAELRMHNLSDGFFLPVCFSKPNVPSSISTTTAQLRNRAGDTYVEINGSQVVKVVAPGGITLQGDVHVTGTVLSDGAIHGKDAVVAGFGTGDQVGLQTHTHSQGPDTHGDVEEDTQAPTPGT